MRAICRRLSELRTISERSRTEVFFLITWREVGVVVRRLLGDLLPSPSPPSSSPLLLSSSSPSLSLLLPSPLRPPSSSPLTVQSPSLCNPPPPTQRGDPCVRRSRNRRRRRPRMTNQTGSRRRRQRRREMRALIIRSAKFRGGESLRNGPPAGACGVALRKSAVTS